MKFVLKCVINAVSRLLCCFGMHVDREMVSANVKLRDSSGVHVASMQGWREKCIVCKRVSE